MFTGLIQEIGTLEGLVDRGSGTELRLAAPGMAPALERGESIAVDGACLTVETHDAAGFTAFASPETLAKTTLGDRQPGDAVNLERALALGGRLGGHLVSGHVDATGRLRAVKALEDAWEVWVEAPAEILRASIPKGSIAIDGISLTLVDLTADAFSVWIIPETWRHTTLSRRAIGSRVNLETDMIGKYVARYLENALGAGTNPGQLEELWAKFRD
ncbi:MAG: riboflavin synthase [Candidatus Sumerlaeota bacterium]|nr:riboflavin synthase [Candidatus Sumerlaeota bacterium]